MLYDLNLSQAFTDFAELENIDYNGFCISQDAKDNLKTILPNADQTLIKPIYTRINLEYTTKIDASSMNYLMKYNLICIKSVDNSNISSVIKLNPDLICLRPEEVKHIKRSFINTLKQKGIFVELMIKDALYCGKQRISWMNSIRRLLKFGCANLLVISSGATVATELKSSTDICKLLNIFGLSDDKVRKILENSEIVLRNAALKRFASHGAVASNVEEGRFKRDFIIEFK